VASPSDKQASGQESGSAGGSSASPLPAKTAFTARALLIGERIDLRALETANRLAASPLTIAVEGGGVAVLFRYGTVILFDVQSETEQAILARLQPLVSQAQLPLETEEVEVRVVPDVAEGMDGGAVCLRDCTVERLQLVAEVLSKSVVLALYETRVADRFQRIEPLAVELEQGRHGTGRARELLRHLGRGLLSELKIVGRVEVTDKPELLWEHPEWERLYLRLAEEFEIRERHLVLGRKLELLSRTASTVLELLQNRRSLRVEWYIVILIVLEILLTLYQMFIGGGSG
jgi:uncharacterized Rmd1/YagE family protein